VPELVERRDPGFRLRDEPGARLGETRAHPVQLLREVPDLVVLPDLHAAVELARADGAGVITEAREGPTDEPVAEDHRREPTHDGDERARERELAVIHVDVAVLRLQRLAALEHRRLLSGNRERDVYAPNPLAVRRRTDGHDVPPRERGHIRREL